MKLRICPERDGACPHGLDCPHAKDRYSCKPSWNTRPNPGDLRRRAAWTPEKANGSRPVTQSGGGVHGPFCTSPKVNRQSIPRVRSIRWKEREFRLREALERLGLEASLCKSGAKIRRGQSAEFYAWHISWPKEAQR